MTNPLPAPDHEQRQSIEQQIAIEQVRLLYTQGRTGIIATLLIGAIVFGAMWFYAPTPFLLFWGLCLAGANLLRYLQIRAYQARDDSAQQHHVYWRRRYQLATALSAAIMGFSAPYFALVTPLPYHIFLMFLQGGMAGAALATLGAVMSVYLLYALLILVPLVITFLWMGDGIHITLGLLSSVFVLMQVYSARHINAAYLRSLRLAIENDVMASNLVRAKAHTDETNRNLQSEIRERRAAQAALSEEKERAQITLESIGDGVITTDTLHRIEYMNPAAERRTGWPLEEARGRRLTEILTLIDEETGDEVDVPLFHITGSEADRPHTGHALLLRRDRRRQYAVEFTVTAIRHRGGNIIGGVAVFHDFTELRSMSHQLAHQASHDALTGLINRREFEHRTEHTLSLARADGSEHALMFLDLDQFKIVNDTCGHLAGDELLRNISALLHSCVRSNDVLARLGGDEFGVLLESCPQVQAKDIAEKMRSIVHEFRFSWEERSFSVGVSIGLVMVTAESGSLTDLLSAADSACYIAKEHGRNRVHVYLPQDEVIGQRRGEMEWVHAMQAALAENRFELYGQALSALASPASEPEYVEVLLRMHDAQGNAVSPGLFIPAAERYQLMHDIDRWVVENALKLLADTPHTQGQETVYAINLSGMSLGEPDFTDFVITRLHASGLPATRLCFEITETAAISNFARAILFIRRLQALGCRFALDDFGSGVSSFAYLKTLPVDYLKIYGGFVKDMGDDPIDAAMVRTINEIGHITGRKTIAEWVENEAIMTRLRDMGVDYAQGYHIARPRPLRECIPAIHRQALP